MYTYFGSDVFSLSILEGLCEVCPPKAVVTQPDRPSGRKQKLTPGPLAVFAKERGFKLHQPEHLKTAELQDPILSDGSELFIVVSFGQILPQSFLDRCPTIINGHASLLPKYRGASPIQSVILNGESSSGMTIMHIVRALDAGPMVACRAFDLASDETHGSLSQKLIADGIDLLTPFVTGTPVPEGEQQDHDQATHCGKLDKSHTRLDPLAKSAAELDRIVRAFCPAPGASLRIATPKGDKQFKILSAQVGEGGPEAGRFVRSDNALVLGCAEGSSLKLEKVQLEGKPALGVEEFLRGFRGELELVKS